MGRWCWACAGGMLRDEHLTEDAFQATFLVLARKAGELRKRGSVASYLYRVAINMAHKVRDDASKSRRSTPPETLPSVPGTPAQASWHEEQDILDQELQRLPEKYRLPLLLCYLEGRTRDEAAQQLGWTTGKLRGLLDRGREQLRSQLVRRGVTLSLAASATLFTDTALSASVSPLLALSTIRASLSFAGGCTLADCGVSASVAALVESCLLAGSKKTLLLAIMLLLTGAIGIGTSVGGPGRNHRPADQVPAVLAFDGPKPPQDSQKPQSGKVAAEPLPDGAMLFTFANNTRGKFADDQVYWAILGNGARHLTLDGKLEPMKVADNSAPGHLTKNGVKYANYFHSLAEGKSIVMPKMKSARLYLSMGSPIYFRVVGSGYAGADVANPADPNHDVYFDFVEFTLDDRGFHGNTTQVDAFGLPVVIELVDDAGMSKKAGISAGRSALFTAFKKEVPGEFAACLKEPYRIVAPHSAGFSKGGVHGTYLDRYLSEVWTEYYRSPPADAAQRIAVVGLMTREDLESVFSVSLCLCG